MKKLPKGPKGIAKPKVRAPIIDRYQQPQQRIIQRPVAMLIIETAFSEREKELARRSLHLSPATLASEPDQINPAPPHPRYPIYITHTKPAETGLIMDEIRRFDDAPHRADNTRHDIRWLSAGQTFEL